jgi:hypothetical protein
VHPVEKPRKQPDHLWPNAVFDYDVAHFDISVFEEPSQRRFAFSRTFEG